MYNTKEAGGGTKLGTMGLLETPRIQLLKSFAPAESKVDEGGARHSSPAPQATRSRGRNTEYKGHANLIVSTGGNRIPNGSADLYLMKIEVPVRLHVVDT